VALAACGSDNGGGAVTFKVTNKGTDKVTELEVTGGDRILGEVENLLPYRSGTGYVPYNRLTDADTRKLSQAIDALAEPLSLVSAKLAGSCGAAVSPRRRPRSRQGSDT
jgi:iron uptake system component EfeO